MNTAWKMSPPPAVQVVEMNFIDRNCPNPSTDNSDRSKNNVPVETVSVTMLDGDALSPKPTLEVEGFTRLECKVDLTGLADVKEAMPGYCDALLPFMKDLTGADEVIVLPFCVVRRQAGLPNPDGKHPADFVHADMTDEGALDMNQYLYDPPPRGKLKRLVHFNMWRLLSETRTKLPLALCDVQSTRPGDLIEGTAYHPSVGRYFGTGFYHPQEHFRWIYYPALTCDDLLIFKQFDSDKSQPSRVPHASFKDPSVPADAPPRVSIEARCVARWYE